MLEGVERGARPGVDPDLAVEVDHVRVHGRLGDVELAGDLLVCQSPCDRTEHIHLTVGEA